MASPDDVATSKAIQQRTGKTFHVATRLLPQRVREATYVLYAFFRVADEVVDDPEGKPPDEQRAELARIREAALGHKETDDPVLSAFRSIKERYGVPDREVNTFMDAMEMDITTDRYDTHADLGEYLRGSSVAVAYMMLEVMDPEEKERARPHAKALGEAFQLTNFLRDVREDIVDYDRIYLPESTLAKHDVTEEQIAAFRFDDDFAAAMRTELERTERLYRDGVEGIQYLPPDCRFGVLLSAVLYAEHHRQIRAHGYDVLSARRTLTTRRRLWLAAKTWYHYKRTGDAVATFEAVSAVPPEEPDDDDTNRRDVAPDPNRGSRWAVPGRSALRAAGSLLRRIGGLV
ncbi:MAG: phytoene/squalene synthase family protein [Halobacteriales archaeon]